MSDAVLFFDTETTGKWNFKLPSTHPSQPRLVQLAWVLSFGEDSSVSCGNFIVDCGVLIPDEAAGIHGITTEMVSHYGVPLRSAIELFCWHVRCASLVVAHNVAFDVAVVSSEWAKLREDANPLEDRDHACTMRRNIDVVQARFPNSADGRGYDGQWKFPTLAETYRHYFGEELVGAHDALVDVKACARVWWEMERRAALVTP